MAVESFHPAVAQGDDVLPNLRDLGGLSTESGGRTRSRVLLRSAAPRHGDRRPDLAGWPPAAVVDLRGGDELGGRSHPLAGPHTEVYALPLLNQPLSRTAEGTVDWSIMPDLATAYRGFLDTGAHRFPEIVRIAARTEGPVLVQCTAGKDRTGVVVAVLLRAAGVDRAAVVADYQATEPALAAILARIPPELSEGADPTVLQRMLGVDATAIQAVLDQVESAPGGAAGWLRSQGVAPSDLAAFTARLTA
jgi:protein-tyrosine phosphatase